MANDDIDNGLDAAREETLQRILAANLALLSQAKGKNTTKGMSPEEKALRAEMKRLMQTYEAEYVAKTKSTDLMKDLADAQTEALRMDKEFNKAKKKGHEDEEKRGKEKKERDLAAIKGLQSFNNVVTNTISGLTGVISNFAGMNNSISSAASSLKVIPVVGGMLSGVFGAVATAAEGSYKAFQQSASVGANFGGSIHGMIDGATKAGLTFDQFSGIIARNGQSLALLGGSSTEGAKRLSTLGKEIRLSGVSDQLNRLGYGTEEINEAMAVYSGRLALTGHLQGATNKDLVSGTGNYLKNLDALSKLTGLSKKDLQSKQEEMMRDSQMRVAMSKLNKEDAEGLRATMTRVPAAFSGLKEIAATGVATTEEGRKIYGAMPKTAAAAAKMNKEMEETGHIAAETRAAFEQQMIDEAGEFSKSSFGAIAGDYLVDSYGNIVVAAHDLAAMSNKSIEQKKAELDAADKEAKLKKDGLDPAAMEKYKQTIAGVSNEFTKLLASGTLLKDMMTVFGHLTGIIKDYVAPVFKFLAEHTTVATVIMVSVAAVATALGAAMTFAAYATTKNAIAQSVSGTSIKSLGTIFKGLFGVVGNLGKLFMTVIRFAGPIALAAAAVYTLYQAVSYLAEKFTESGWSISDVFESLGDTFKSFMITLNDVATSMLSILPPMFGGISKEEKASRLKLSEERRKELEDRKKERTTRVAATKEVRAAEKADALAKEKSADSEEDITKRKKEAAEEQLTPKDPTGERINIFQEEKNDELRKTRLALEAEKEKELAEATKSKGQQVYETSTTAARTPANKEFNDEYKKQYATKETNRKQEKVAKSKLDAASGSMSNAEYNTEYKKQYETQASNKTQEKRGEAKLAELHKDTIQPQQQASNKNVSTGKITKSGKDASFNMANYLQSTALIESGGKANAKAETSSASGLFQFTESTWKENVKAMGKSYSLDDRFDPAKATEVAEYFTQQQKNHLEKSTGKNDINSTDMYLAHFLGAGGAAKFINALSNDPSAPATAGASKSQIDANASIFYADPKNKEGIRSLSEVYGLMQKKMGNAESALATGKWGKYDIPDVVASIGTVTKDGKPTDNPQANGGGVFNGPKAGYNVTLHGQETVLPGAVNTDILTKGMNSLAGLLMPQNKPAGQEKSTSTFMSDMILSITKKQEDAQLATKLAPTPGTVPGAAKDISAKMADQESSSEERGLTGKLIAQIERLVALTEEQNRHQRTIATNTA